MIPFCGKYFMKANKVMQGSVYYIYQNRFLANNVKINEVRNNRSKLLPVDFIGWGKQSKK